MAKRIKHVFNNSMCAHVWAQQTQDHGRSGNMHFQDTTLFSYHTPIVNIVKDAHGVTTALMTSHTYSPSSSQHSGEARRSFTGPIFYVPSLGASGGRDRNAFYVDHKYNQRHLLEQYEKLKARLLRARIFYQTGVEYLDHCYTQATEYAKAFNLECNIPLATDAAEIDARIVRLKALENSPKRIAERTRKAENKRIAEERRFAEAKIRHADNLIAWLNGHDNYLAYEVNHDDNGGALLRRKDENTVQTSMGAEVPYEHAVTLYRIAHFCRKQESDWLPSEVPMLIGHFTVNRIEKDGTLHIGCHKLNWPIIEAFAKANNFSME